jgi:hypothetical protein
MSKAILTHESDQSAAKLTERLKALTGTGVTWVHTTSAP